MNRIDPTTPLSEVTTLMERDGYVVMENALTPEQLATVKAAYDEQLANNYDPAAKRIELKRILESDERFEFLMDLPPVFRLARALIGADLELASSGELDHKMPRTPAHISWHNDFMWMVNVPYPRQNFWIRCTYFMTDVTDDMGPFTLLPGSHRKGHAPPPECSGADGQPRELEGMVRITGPAGSCLINNTEIWHSNMPNISDRPRPLIMVLYKHAWMKQWQEGYETTAEFAARQTDLVRRQLCRGNVWHYDESRFPAAQS